MNKIRESIGKHIGLKRFQRIDLKAVLFDMDGVLYDSMPYHAKAWVKTMREHGFKYTEQEAYIHEGRTGSGTIKLICRQQGIHMTDKAVGELYHEKAEEFNKYTIKPMPGSYGLLQKVAAAGLTPMLVTGSGQSSLLERLMQDFPHIFSRERMVTSSDVKRGKPDPEPYLTALGKGSFAPHEAIVVENAPLGVEAAKAAGIFTIAANTGPLPDSALLEAGADLLYPSIEAISEDWEILLGEIRNWHL